MKTTTCAGTRTGILFGTRIKVLNRLLIYSPAEKKKEETRMINDFFAFNINGINNILYLLQTNLSFIIILIGVIGIAFLRLKYEVDMAVNEEENIL